MLSVLDVPIEVNEPESGKSSKTGALSRLKPAMSISDTAREAKFR